jgi:hypothetical protein
MPCLTPMPIVVSPSSTSGHRPICDRLEAVRPSVRGRDDQQRRRSVVKGAGVARRDSPARLEDRLEFGELLQRGVAPGTLVCLDDGFGLAGSDGDRYDLIAEALLVLCGNGLLVAPQGDAVLALAGDIVPVGELFGPLHLGRELEALLGQVLGGHPQGSRSDRAHDPGFVRCCVGRIYRLLSGTRPGRRPA